MLRQKRRCEESEREREKGRLEESNDLNFKAHVLRKTSNLDSRASRKRLISREVLGVFGVHLTKIVHVTHEDSGLHNLGHVTASFLEDGLNVVENQAGLSSDAVLVMELTSCRVKRDLSRGKKHTVHLDSLTVRTNGLGSLLCGNDGLAVATRTVLAAVCRALALTLTATGALLAFLAFILVARALLGALAFTLTATGALLAFLAFLLVARALLGALALTLTATGALLALLAFLLVARALLGALAFTLTATGALGLSFSLLGSSLSLVRATTLHDGRNTETKKNSHRISTF